jgi:hypothetical protein
MPRINLATLSKGGCGKCLFRILSDPPRGDNPRSILADCVGWGIFAGYHTNGVAPNVCLSMYDPRDIEIPQNPPFGPTLMNRHLLPLSLFVAGLLSVGLTSAWADPPKEARPKYPPYGTVLADAQTIEGLIKLHRKDMRLLAELSPADMNRDFMVATAIARGIGQTPLIGGMTLDFDDTWLWQFRRTEDRIQIVRRNVRFRASRGSPQEKSVFLSYTDSVLFSLPIVTMSPTGNVVIDLTPVFMGDLPQISQVMRGFGFAADRSTWSQVKGFRDNVEIEVAATYASGGLASIETVADTRAATLYLHYSISRLPETGYQPRLADDRVGYFLAVIKDFSKTGENDRFVRYINRWDLRKAEAASAVSPPVTPIIFWIEKTVPFKYRAAVRDGILEWNKAYERAGFSNAIEVRQQPDDATWDPEDIRYNTFRWISVSAGFAMGPSRTNPLTGQILDADIIFDADMVESWMKQIQIEKADAASLLGLRSQRETESQLIGQQLAFGSIALASKGSLSKEKIDKMVIDGVRSIVTHEVGHTLGLRHNFKSSALLSMDEVNDPEKNRTIGLTGSIMDYTPVNISPKGKKQGDYFSRTIGPYDYWAIEYGYKPLPGGTDGEVAQLAKIASRCTEPQLQYATDYDADSAGPDPLVNRFDLSKDLVEYARWRVELINQLLPDIVDRSVETGEGYDQARRAFLLLIREHSRAMGFVVRYIGGVNIDRNHKGDPNARPPVAVTEPKKQREALEYLEQQVFGPDAYKFPPKLYEFLAASHWQHWGMRGLGGSVFPVQDLVLAMQGSILSQMLSPATLSRVLDAEFKTPADQDAFTAAEMLASLSGSIFRETDKLQAGKFTNRTPAISSLRRNLQQRYFEQLADLALGNAGAPADCQTVAAAELASLRTRIDGALNGKAELDVYTRSHLKDLSARITKVLDSRVLQPRP